MNKWNLYWNSQSNRNVSRKVDKERITVGSFLANGFGLRIFMGGVFSKRVRTNLTFLFLCVFVKFEVFGVRNYEIGV